MANDSKDLLKKVARWSGFIGSVLTFILGIVHLFNTKASLSWPSNFIDDNNEGTWRRPLFSFAPETFVDTWTPFVFGAVGTLCHFKQFNMEAIVSNFLRFFIFHLIMGFFATIGYAGGLGILFSIPVWLCCLLSLIAAFVDDDKATLELTANFNLKSSNS